MSRLALLVLFVAAIAARAAYGRHPPPSEVHNDTIVTVTGAANGCHSQLFVKTEDKYGAGTDSKIDFELFDDRNFSISLDMDGSQDDSTFEMGTTTAVSTDNMHCMHPCRITITSDGKGDWPSWRCEYVRVVVSGDAQSDETFDVNKWIGPGKDESMSVNIDKCAKPAATVASS